ncbi:hypothetical protein HHL11_02075 [Ramlibacter sp. G-1-2-2]|uniref:Lipoprotein n=1 Tax=Ramlibacter agri TaxID=2728837 RepID=A0A848H432_9BURK|nr:hypothetical protein [Ramlibacter agri]NML42518.1 hypothetical protein [Ramlibacter agri]
MKTQAWLSLVALAALTACVGNNNNSGEGNAGECLGSAQACSGGETNKGVPATFFSKSGTGAGVVTLPNITRLRIRGTTTGASAEFAVWIGDRLVVGETVGSHNVPAGFDGVFVVKPGETVKITQAAKVAWSLDEVAPEPTPSTAGIFGRSDTDADVFRLPAKPMRLRVQALYPGARQRFAVWADGTRLLVNESLGTSQNPPAYEGTIQVKGGEVIEVRSASGVTWSFKQQ